MSLFEATRRLLTGSTADHEIRLQGQPVRYVLKRAKRRTIGFMIGPNGLRVSAPRWTGLAEIEVALQVKAGWILAKLADQDQRRERRDASKVDWQTGATLPYLGEPLMLVVDAPSDAARKTRVWLEPGVHPGTARLHVVPAAAGDRHAVRDAVVGWLKQRALALFMPRCEHFAERLDVRYAAVRLSSAQTRWGSASSAGVIRLSWRLVHFPTATIDYVVAHELAHLREMNHSPRFWAVVESVVPHYRELRGTLQSDSLPILD
ncbi:MAG: metal-dependent hydrolase [Rhizobacter sp.]|nr:metal-dependent hydrolase [Rhizobacter sp.]